MDHTNIISQESLSVAPETTPEFPIVEVPKNDLIEADVELIEPLIEPNIPTIEVRQESLEVVPVVEPYENDINFIEPTIPAVEV